MHNKKLHISSKQFFIQTIYLHRVLKRITDIVFALCILFVSSLAYAQRPDGLAITTNNETYNLTVPVSNLELKIPKVGITTTPINLGGATSNPRYFHFNSMSGLEISGWFESSSGYKDVYQFWEHELGSWQKSKLPDPINVNINKIGNWDVVSYQQPIPLKSDLSSANIRAHWVQAGTWIDVHISYTSNNSYEENLEVAKSFLKAMVVQEKTPISSPVPDVRVSIPNYDDLVFKIPEGWTAKVEFPIPNLPPTIVITSKNQQDLSMLITPIWPANASIKALNATAIRDSVQHAADLAKSQAVETQLNLIEINFPNKIGYYFFVTDRAPEPGEYKYMKQGIVGFDELCITFTILANTESTSLNEQALTILKTMLREAPKNAS